MRSCLDVLEQQQLSTPEPSREHWADQQDPPQGEVADTNLLGLDEGEGAAPGAPVEEVVVQGPPTFNIFHGESLPRLIEADPPVGHTPRVKEEVATGHSGAAPSAPETMQGITKKEEEEVLDPVLPVDSGIGEVDYTPDDEELPEAEAEEPTAPTEGAASSGGSSGG